MGIGHHLSKLPSPLKEFIKERIYPAPLMEGAQAPEWHLQAQDRSWHRQGRFWVVMHFLPACTAQPVVQQALRELQAHQAELKALKARVYAVMPAEEADLQQVVADFNLDYPLLTDRGASVARLFKAALQVPLKPLVIPTVYLVNPQGKIRLANRGAPSIAAVVRSIQALQESTRNGM